MNKKLPFDHLRKVIYYLTGMFITMPIVMIYINGSGVSAFGVFFGLFILLLILNSSFSLNKKLINIKVKLLITWFSLALIAAGFGNFYFNGEAEWTRNINSYIPKLLLYILVTILLSTVNNLTKIINPFLNGLIAGFTINILWSIGEGLSFYLFGFILNNEIFSTYASTLPPDRATMTVIADGIIRASGLNTDPAHLGGIIPVIIIYSLIKKKYFLIFLSLISLAFSGSTTALLSSIFAILISYGKLNILVGLKNTIFNARSLAMLTISSTIIFSFILSNKDINQSIEANIKGFYDRTTNTYISDVELGPRYIYHAYLPEAVFYSSIMTLTGSGFGTASYPYVSSPNIPKADGMEYFPYDPESTYISYLFDVGWIGLIIYSFMLLLLIRHYRKNLNSNTSYQIIYATLCGIIFSGFFYHYTLTAYQVMILIFAAISSSKEIKIREQFL